MKVHVVSTTGGRHLAATFVGNSAIGGGSSSWKYASVPLSSYDTYRVEFETEAGGSDATLAGYVAIDDVSFTDSCRSGDSNCYYFAIDSLIRHWFMYLSSLNMPRYLVTFFQPNQRKKLLLGSASRLVGTTRFLPRSDDAENP